MIMCWTIKWKIPQYFPSVMGCGLLRQNADLWKSKERKGVLHLNDVRL